MKTVKTALLVAAVLVAIIGVRDILAARGSLNRLRMERDFLFGEQVGRADVLSEGGSVPLTVRVRGGAYIVPPGGKVTVPLYTGDEYTVAANILGLDIQISEGRVPGAPE